MGLKVNPTTGLLDLVSAYKGGVSNWSALSASGTASANIGYILDSNSNLSINLPFTASVGDVIKIVGIGSGGWTLKQITGQVVHFGVVNTTSGSGGSLASTHTADALELICVVLNSEWNVSSSVGNITYV
jgi:hypothetical protein